MKALKLKTLLVVGLFSAGLVGCDESKEKLELVNLFENECTKQQGKLTATMTLNQWNNGITLICSDYVAETSN